jgi:cytochrome c-type biogenesis protein CcmH/NrfG
MPSMNRKNLIAIAVAAIVVVALVVIVPGLASKGDTATTNAQTAAGGQTAGPISPGDTVPPGHPAVDASASTTGTTLDATALVTAAEAAYKAKPKDLQTLLSLGDVYIQTNRPDDATKIFNEALGVDSTSSLAKVGLAMAKFVKGDATGAQADLEALVVANPKDQTAQYDLAIVYFQAGQTDKAKAAWVAAAAIDPASELGNMSQQFVTMMNSPSGSSSGSSNPHGTAAATTTTT